MSEVVKHAELLLMVIPTPFVASTIKGIKDQLRPDQVRFCSIMLVDHITGCSAGPAYVSKHWQSMASQNPHIIAL